MFVPNTHTQASHSHPNHTQISHPHPYHTQTCHPHHTAVGMGMGGLGVVAMGGLGLVGMGLSQILFYLKIIIIKNS